MESIQNLKRRIKGAQNIGQITKAMELVSATKMRKAQEIALDSRPYAYAALELLGTLTKLSVFGGAEGMPGIMTERSVEKTAFLLAASDRGLAGSFNGSVFRAFENFVKREKIDVRDPRYTFIAIGQKTKQYLERRGMHVAASFTHVGDFTSLPEADPITDFLIEGYIRGDFDKVVSFVTTFVSALRQDVIIRDLLPVTFNSLKRSVEELIPRTGRYSQYLNAKLFESADEAEYLIEPSPGEVLDRLAPQLLKVRIHNLLMEANASEHSARRLAMKNASDNASDLSQRLNIEYNKSRQAAITNQIIEVTSGANIN
jgi:F-type H+-transporting ATPase subunit gamma